MERHRADSQACRKARVAACIISLYYRTHNYVMWKYRSPSESQEDCGTQAMPRIFPIVPHRDPCLGILHLNTVKREPHDRHLT